MRSALSRQVRAITGVAPVLHFPAAAKNKDQVSLNTAKALEMIKAQLGAKPEPYTRKFDTPFAQIKSEVETILKSCGSKEEPLQDGKELTQMQVIERVLRHGICSYEKDEGACSFEDMQKWLVYTPSDLMEFNKLKREKEVAEKYEQFKASNTEPVLPKFDWAAEYEAVLDREIVSEKRHRYDQVAATSFERDEAAIEAELKAYKKPVMDESLDRLIEQVQLFKPFLAKKVIQAKLIERNMDGQLTFSRFADWNPDARDISELHTEAQLARPGSIEEPLTSFDETSKRYAEVRMKTKEEVLETMQGMQEKAQVSI
ncbi:hypothetical protein DIPPA_22291 [Diplonema papillatum]|nr:hypothetical protein DIPPA_22291 [Diplonema papillatum]KAJ9456943.1 hypothetical protein DIPPA_22291 [Diplonema papillatum]